MPRQNGNQTPRRRRGDRPQSAAFPGRLAKVHVRRWYQAKELVKDATLRPCAREVMDALLTRVRHRPHLELVMVGYGGVRDRRHKEWLEAEKAAGREKRPGLAEITKRSRSGMIRAVRQLVDQGFLRRELGVGRGHANAYQLGPACGVTPGELEAHAEAVRLQAQPENVDWSTQREMLRRAREKGLGARGDRGPPPSAGGD